MSKIEKLAVFDFSGKAVEQIIMPEFLCLDFKQKLIQEVYEYHSLNRRQATYGTLNRSELSYSGKKLWQQKRTGRARIGERGAVHHRKGNVCFGPDGRTYDIKMPKKKVRAALFSLLSYKLSQGELTVINNMNMEKISTKEAINNIFNINKIYRRSLVIDNKDNNNLIKSLGNIPNVDFLPNIAFNVYDLFGKKHVIMSLESLKNLEKLYES